MSATRALLTPVFRVHIPDNGRVLLQVLPSTTSEVPDRESADLAEEPVDLTTLLTALLLAGAGSSTPPIDDATASPFASISFPTGFRAFRDGRRISTAEVGRLLEIAVRDAVHDAVRDLREQHETPVRS